MKLKVKIGDLVLFTGCHSGPWIGRVLWQDRDDVLVRVDSLSPQPWVISPGAILASGERDRLYALRSKLRLEEKKREAVVDAAKKHYFDVKDSRLDYKKLVKQLSSLGLFVALVALCVPARASPICPTLAEARAAFSGHYLYWHTARHCWNATPGRRRHDAPTPVPPPRPDKTPMLLFPTLVQSGAELDPAFLAPEPASVGPVLLDVDEITAGPVDEPPAAAPEANFRDRWSVMPAAWFMARKD
jgi:hypothetical protein